MKKIELLEIGFIDTSYFEEEIEFREFTLITENNQIQVSGINTVEICFIRTWVDVPNCNSIEDLKKLIELFNIS